jgi:hypothetical protein
MFFKKFILINLAVLMILGKLLQFIYFKIEGEPQEVKYLKIRILLIAFSIYGVINYIFWRYYGKPQDVIMKNREKGKMVLNHLQYTASENKALINTENKQNKFLTFFLNFFRRGNSINSKQKTN